MKERPNVSEFFSVARREMFASKNCGKVIPDVNCLYYQGLRALLKLPNCPGQLHYDSPYRA